MIFKINNYLNKKLVNSGSMSILGRTIQDTGYTGCSKINEDEFFAQNFLHSVTCQSANRKLRDCKHWNNNLIVVNSKVYIFLFKMSVVINYKYGTYLSVYNHSNTN